MFAFVQAAQATVQLLRKRRKTWNIKEWLGAFKLVGNGVDSILHAWRHFGQKHKNNKNNNEDIIIMELYRLPRQWRLLEMKIDKLDNMLRHLIFKTFNFLILHGFWI